MLSLKEPLSLRSPVGLPRSCPSHNEVLGFKSLLLNLNYYELGFTIKKLSAFLVSQHPQLKAKTSQLGQRTGPSSLANTCFIHIIIKIGLKSWNSPTPKDLCGVKHYIMRKQLPTLKGFLNKNDSLATHFVKSLECQTCTSRRLRSLRPHPGFEAQSQLFISYWLELLVSFNFLTRQFSQL